MIFIYSMLHNYKHFHFINKTFCMKFDIVILIKVQKAVLFYVHYLWSSRDFKKVPHLKRWPSWIVSMATGVENKI